MEEGKKKITRDDKRSARGSDEMSNIWQKFGGMQWNQRNKVAGPGKSDDDSSPLERG